MRYGWETGWTRSPPSIRSPLDVHVIGHEPTPAFDFVPSADVLDDPGFRRGLGLGAPRQAGTEPVRAALCTIGGQLDHQIAFFRRGDSAIVVAAFDASDQSGFAHDTIDAAIAIAPATSPDSTTVITDSAARRHDVLVADSGVATAHRQRRGTRLRGAPSGSSTRRGSSALIEWPRDDLGSSAVRRPGDPPHVAR